MDAFPFDDADWQRVEDVATAITNATLADDDALSASHFESLREIVDELRGRYGDHPILKETEADFLGDPTLRLEGYRAAIRLASQHGLATYTARISLAQLLLDDFCDPGQAAMELKACQAEIERSTDSWYKEEWQKTMDRCEEYLPSRQNTRV